MSEPVPTWEPRLMTLCDGSLAFSDSEAYRMECEARMLLRDYPLEARREFLTEIERRRGPEAAESLRQIMIKLYEASK